MALYGKIRDKIRQPFRSAVIVAAGSSTRLGQDKLMLSLEGMPVLARTLRAFQDCTLIDEIIIVTRADRLEEFAALRDRYCVTKLSQVVVGGETRSGSSLAGVMAASKKATVIAIHDGARPLVTPELIERVILKAEKRQAAAPVLPLKDTVKERSGDMLVHTPPRETLAAVQTPQVFEASSFELHSRKRWSRSGRSRMTAPLSRRSDCRLPPWRAMRKTSRSRRRSM